MVLICTMHNWECLSSVLAYPHANRFSCCLGATRTNVTSGGTPRSTWQQPMAT